MKLEQNLVRSISETEHLKQFVSRYDVMYDDHEIFIYIKEISNTETQYDVDDEIESIEEKIGFAITLIDDTEAKKKKLGNPYP